MPLRSPSIGETLVTVEIGLSLGKTVAQITAIFAPIPGLSGAAEVLCTIIQLCQNASQNRFAVRQLADRCHVLLVTLKDSMANSPPNQFAVSNAVVSVVNCLIHVQNCMESWAKVNRLQAFSRQNDISRDIQRCHDLISDCLTNFQIVSHTEIHHWQEEFERNTRRDHEEIIDYLAEIQHGQAIAADAQQETAATVRNIMSKLQMLLGENKTNADRRHNGLSSNLYQLQFQSGELLPNFHLDSGEVIRIGQFPVSGTAAMDIYEGLYLQREKVAIKIVRAINANDQSLRRFMREAKIWAEIWQKDRGRHILPFYGFCQTDGPFPYMVSPWQQNGNALSYVRKHDRAVDHRQLIKGIAQGIAVLHTMDPPIVHGDIKSTNIVIDARGGPLLADFGLSRIVEDITGIPFTQSRGVSESYRWFAPEVCVGQGVLSLSSDVYAFAMTVVELMTHSQPYANIKHTTEVVIRSSRGEMPPRPVEPRVIERGLTDALWGDLTSCWAIVPSERPTISEVLSKLSV